MRLHFFLLILCFILLLTTACVEKEPPIDSDANEPDSQPVETDIRIPQEPDKQQQAESPIDAPSDSATAETTVTDDGSTSTVGYPGTETLVQPPPDAGFDGWLRQWGRARIQTCNGVDMDSAGNLYVTGGFTREADFDPGQGAIEIESVGETDVFVSKFSPSGEYLWTRTFGGRHRERVMDLGVDSSGNSYITGSFISKVDFDPGDGEEEVEEITAKGSSDVFLCSLNPDGDFRWVRTWGGDFGEVDAMAVAVDGGGNSFVTGWFFGTMYFDPFADEGDRSAEGATARSGSDAYVSKFSSNGTFRWTATWGGDDPEFDQITGTSITTDAGGNVFVAGRFQGRYEISTARGIDMNFGWHTSGGLEDAFVCKLDANGYPQWARSWGGEQSEYAMAVAVSPSGNIYVAGGFEGVTDLNPDGHRVDEYVAEYGGFAFLSKFSSNGGYQWGRTWGEALVLDVAVDRGGDIVLTGTARGLVDFDPDPDENAVDERDGSVFICKYDSTGDYKWGNSWGRTDHDMGTSLVLDGADNIYATGLFRGELNYIPDEGFTYTPLSFDADAFLIKLLPNGGW